MKSKKILLAILIFLGMILLGTSKSSATTVNDLRNKFPNGKYWNHVVGSDHYYEGNLVDKGSCNTPDGYTSSPCHYHSGSPAPYGQVDCTSFDGAQECLGFARKLFYDYYGTYASGRIGYPGKTNLKP